MPRVRDYRPKIDGIYLEPEEITKFLVAYNDFTYKGRPPMRNEVCGLMAIYLNRKIGSILHEMFNRFDDANDPLTLQARERADGDSQVLLERIKDCFEEYLEKDEEAKGLAQDCEGL